MTQIKALAWRDPRGRMLSLFLFCGALLVLLTSCNVSFSTGEIGSGNVVSENRTVDAFSAIAFDGIGDLYIEQGDSSEVIVEADDNFIDRIETEVRDETLHINTVFGQSISNPTSLRYNVTVTDLAGLNIDGAGDTFITGLETGELRITADGAADAQISDVHVDMLAVVIDGSGELEISGKAATQQVTMKGAADYLAAELQSHRVGIVASGAGSAVVHADEYLTATINDAASIEYLGNPLVEEVVQDAGSLKRHSQ
jgi:hypothetical protein